MGSSTMSAADLPGRQWDLHSAVDLAANGHAGIAGLEALQAQYERLLGWAEEQRNRASAAVSAVIAGDLDVETSKTESEIAGLLATARDQCARTIAALVAGAKP